MSAKTNKEKTVISVKIDKKTQKEAKKLANSLGLSLSQIVNDTFKKFIREKEYNFSEKTYIMKPKLEKIIEQAEAEYSRGEVDGPFTYEEAMKYLRL